MTGKLRKILMSALSIFPRTMLAELALAAEKILADDGRYVSLLQRVQWDKEGFSWIAQKNAWRPSKETLEVYEKFLPVSPTPARILLLGSTPELRDMLARAHPSAQVVLCDFSWKMTILMSTLCQVADPDREVWVKANWLSMPFPDHSFDVVLGDMLFMQLSPQDEGEFLKKIAKVMTKEGVFITRSRIRGQAFSREDAERVMSDVLRQCAGRTKEHEKSARQLARAVYEISPLPGSRTRDHVWAKQVVLERLRTTTSTDERVILERANAIIERDESTRPIMRARVVDHTEQEFQDLLNERFVISDSSSLHEENSGEYYVLIKAMQRGA